MPVSAKTFISDTSRNYYYILVFLAASVPVSIFTTSIAEILLLINWLAEGNFSGKFRSLKARKTPFIIASLFAIHLLGLINTSDFNYAFHDLKIKLPILLLPLIIGSSVALSEKQIRTLLLLFTSSVFVSSLISSSIFFGLVDYEYYDFREISLFISHIRMSLMVNFSLFILLYYGFGGDETPFVKKGLKIVFIVVAIWFAGFLLILKSVTGIIIFFLLGLFLAWKYSGKIRDVAPKFILRVLIISVPLVIASWLSHAVTKFYSRDTVDFTSLDTLTPGGNPYSNDPELQWYENGHYVWMYVCEEELREEWNRRSELGYDGKDRRGQVLRYTLIRYLTSKDYRKDASGVIGLSEEDIRAVEDGVANYIFLNKYSLYPRVYQIIWELDSYKSGNNPSGHSVAQRFAYNRAALNIIRNNFMFGVGTGDVQQEFNNYYTNCDNPLVKKYRRRAHNQFTTFLLTFGIIGFILCLSALLIPIILEKGWKDYLFLCFGIIGFLSLLNEDTLETQTGVTFFMFFYALLLFGRQNSVSRGKPNL